MGREATFKSKDQGLFFIRTGGDGHKSVHFDEAVSDIRIDRLPRMPAVCDTPTPNTPLDNFEVFTRTWAEHYISFDLKRTDWEKVVSDIRQKITAQTTPAELFDIFEAMIAAFHDLHT